MDKFTILHSVLSNVCGQPLISTGLNHGLGRVWIRLTLYELDAGLDPFGRDIQVLLREVAKHLRFHDIKYPL